MSQAASLLLYKWRQLHQMHSSPFKPPSTADGGVLRLWVYAAEYQDFMARTGRLPLFQSFSMAALLSRSDCSSPAMASLSAVSAASRSPASASSSFSRDTSAFAAVSFRCSSSILFAWLG